MKSIYNDSGQRIGFELESQAERDDFEKLCELARRLRDDKFRKAQEVFDLVLRGSETVDLDDSSGAGESAVWGWADSLDDAIRQNLNHQTIGAFVSLVLKHGESSAQAARAVARHAENHAMKQEVFEWLNANMARYPSMDAAADDIAGKVVPVKWRTARDWVALWKKLRSAGTA